MDQYVIKGGIPLQGEVTVSGAKNSALGILAATVLTDEQVCIKNLPDISDIDILLNAIEEIGASVTRKDRNTVLICGANIKQTTIESENVRKIRGSYYLVGSLLGRFKSAGVLMPGGCNIGSRPIDQHLKGFRALGADAEITHGMVKADAKELVGAHIYFDCTSVGATINLMLASCLAKGQTILENSAKEPHVVDVANFLNSMGANIKGAGTDIIRITGVEKLHKSTYSIIPDQIEAGTFMLAAAATKGDVVVKNVIPKHLEAITAKLVEIGASVVEMDDAVRVTATDRLKSTSVRTYPYPGFPTDLQAPMTTLLSVSSETSTLTESIFDGRFKYVDELAKMSAKIKVENNVAVITGVDRLTGSKVVASDLRAGAALVIAGLMAEGFTTVEQIEYVERGYENLEGKLRKLGAEIIKTDSKDEKTVKKFKLKVG
ncbi:MAG: UDP-N-acetylglucosamine 1-carboxyvinyltransferase [Lachnospiraceae bacterium]|nr:UDP-N-acetylglucosamine 1-carboxyvinyltransferase [Lachnospiraceae bacterium]